jgi:hypothetical protein
MPQKGNLFGAEDIEILSHAVSIHPNLEYACYVAKVAKKHLKFPIKTYEEVDPLFSIKDLPGKISKRKLSKAHLRKFFPKEFFPIEGVEDFLGKILAALSQGDVIHYHEQHLKNPERFTPVRYGKEPHDANRLRS